MSIWCESPNISRYFSFVSSAPVFTMVVGTAVQSNRQRLVTEIRMEKKVKSQKAKTKLSDGRKQLSSVRVIQRNLVYIVGLPLNLVDEDLLTGKEYFAQYGKILKVSISRTSAGTNSAIRE